MYQPGGIRTLKKLSEAQKLVKSGLADLDNAQDDASSSDVSSQEELKFEG